MKTSLLVLLLLAPSFGYANSRSNPCGSSKVIVRAPAEDTVTGLPPILCKVLVGVANKFGTVTIVSGIRPFKANKRRDGADNSMHLAKNGGAYDFQITNRADKRVQRALANYLSTYKNIRYNVYPAGGGHIDASNRADMYDTALR